MNKHEIWSEELPYDIAKHALECMADFADENTLVPEHLTEEKQATWLMYAIVDACGHAFCTAINTVRGLNGRTLDEEVAVSVHQEIQRILHRFLPPSEYAHKDIHEGC